MQKSNESFVAVWLDHAKAIFLVNGEKPEVKSIIEASSFMSGHEHMKVKHDTTDNESVQQNKAANISHSYFKHIISQLLPYNEIYLFGPTTAPRELHNLLKDDSLFKGKSIIVDHSDYLTENQIAEKVKEAFNRKKIFNKI